MTSPAELSLCDAAERIRSRALSSREVTADCVERLGGLGGDSPRVRHARLEHRGMVRLPAAANGFLDGVLNSDMDSQRICFEQGKALIYMSGQDSKVIIAKELGGVVKHRRISDAAVTRTWPDGRVDHLHRGDTEDLACPYIPPTAK